MKKVLVCGTKFFSYNDTVRDLLRTSLDKSTIVIEGCCKGSADQVAEEVAVEKRLEIRHFPAKGSPLDRNVSMVKECDEVLAFWDGRSYGTAHTIATAVLHDKKVTVVPFAAFQDNKARRLSNWTRLEDW